MFSRELSDSNDKLYDEEFKARENSLRKNIYLSKFGKENKRLKETVISRDNLIYQLSMILYNVLCIAEAGIKKPTSRADMLKKIIETIKPMFPQGKPPQQKPKSHLDTLKSAEERLKKEKPTKNKKSIVKAALNAAAKGTVTQQERKKLNG